jgi:cytochrome c-type biogenesis protein CcmH
LGKKRVALSLMLLALPYPAGATSDSLVQRAHALAQEVRCPVCLGQSLVDSDTRESEILKTFILERLHKGESEETIREKLRVVYGDKILFRPPFDSRTFFLWMAPFGLLFCVVLGLFWRVRGEILK